MTMKIQGLDSLLALLMRASDDVKEAVHDGLEELAFKVLKEAKTRTPVDTGFLRSSGTVEMLGDKAIVRFEAEYALPVHERVEVPHSNGEAKFLENAVNVTIEKARVISIFERRIKELFGL